MVTEEEAATQVAETSLSGQKRRRTEVVANTASQTIERRPKEWFRWRTVPSLLYLMGKGGHELVGVDDGTREVLVIMLLNARRRPRQVPGSTTH